MPNFSATCAHSSLAHCALSICLCLSFFLSSTLITVSDQMLRCAELQSDAEYASASASEWDYCVDETPATCNWYQAMAACRSFGGELVFLEWLQKIENIQERLSEFGVNLSSVCERSSAVLLCKQSIRLEPPAWSGHRLYGAMRQVLFNWFATDYMLYWYWSVSSVVPTCFSAKGGYLRIGKFAAYCPGSEFL